MANQAVHWEEGMFLTPQHFQAADRHARRSLAELEDWFHPFPWGYRSLAIDEKNLAAGQLILKSCRARLPDGTHVNVGEDDEADVPPLSINLTEALNAEERIDIYLAVPSYKLGLPNAEDEPETRAEEDDEAPRAPDRGPRFIVEKPREFADENTGRNPKPLRLRRVRACLLLGTDDLSGYVYLPLARVQRGADKGSKPELVGKVVPALLSLDASTWLRDLVGEIAREIRGRLRQLAELAVDRELSFRGQDPGDAERLLKLQALNEVEPPLALLARTPGVPPLPVYVELCRAVGRLGLFLRDRRPPKLPPYDHNNPGSCFSKVIDLIRQALEGAEPVRAIAAPLSRTGKHLQTSLQEGWIDLRRLYLAVETDVTPEECDAVLKDEQVDRTIGSGGQVEELYNRRSRGIALTAVPRPEGLPARSTTEHLPHIAYFRFNPAEQPRLWQGILHHRTLAVRFNVNESPFLSDQEVQVTARTSPQDLPRPVRLRFVVYVMPER